MKYGIEVNTIVMLTPEELKSLAQDFRAGQSVARASFPTLYEFVHTIYALEEKLNDRGN